MYRKILQEPLTFPSSDIVPPAARDLLTRLLDRDPQRRLGATGAAEIKSHHFFANIDWRKLLQRKYEPSFRPSVVCVPQRLIVAVLGSIYLLTMLSRLMPLTRTTLTASSPPRLPRTHMSMARPCRQPCSNSSSGGRITDRLQVSVTPVVVSRIPPSAASPSKSRTSAGCLHQLDRVWCARRGFIDMILPLYRVFCRGPHITNLDHFHLSSCLVFLVLFLPSQGVRGILVSESHPQFPRQISFCAVVFSSLKSQILRPVERFGSFFVLIPSQRHQSPSRTGSDAPLQARFRWFFSSGHCSALYVCLSGARFSYAQYP